MRLQLGIFIYLYCFCYIHLLVVLGFFFVSRKLFGCSCCRISLWSFLLLSWNLLMWPVSSPPGIMCSWFEESAYLDIWWNVCWGIAYCVDMIMVLSWNFCLIWYWVYVVYLLIDAWYLMFIGIVRLTVDYVWLWVMVMGFLHVRSLVWLVGFGFGILYLISTFKFIN